MRGSVLFSRAAKLGVGVILVVAALVGALYVASEIVMRRPTPQAKSHTVAGLDPLAAERGARIAKIYGCAGCHGEGLQGQLFHDEPMLVRAFAPNVSRVIASHTDGELDRAIRGGVGVDGRRLWMMPSAAYSLLSDGEAADLLAYLRTLEAAGTEQPRSQFGPIVRVAVLLGKLKSEPENIVSQKTESLADLGPNLAEGRQAARACVECHGPTLAGNPIIKAPDLTMAASYDAEQFKTLMKTGKASDGRELTLMSGASRERFAAFSDHEIEQLHAYLNARATIEADRMDRPR